MSKRKIVKTSPKAVRKPARIVRPARAARPQAAPAPAAVWGVPGLGELQSVAGESGRAVREALQTAGEGVREFNREVIDGMQARSERTFAMLRELSEATSLQDAIAVQTSFLKTELEETVARSRKMAEISAGLVREAFAPVNGLFERIRSAA